MVVCSSDVQGQRSIPGGGTPPREEAEGEHDHVLVDDEAEDSASAAEQALLNKGLASQMP